MKKISFILLSIALLYAVHPPHSSAQGNVSVELFYNALAPQGDWIEAGEYGYVWQPREIEADWRPYSNGHWVYTDLGWTWVADERESWGWATYHYGRWTRLNEVGWVWVPGTEWAPAWVSFRHSDRHVGWAPLPPEARFVRTVGFQPWVDSYYDIGPTSYTFVETRSFGSLTLRTVILPVVQNIEIINTTRNITVINYRQNNIYVGGPEYDVVSRVSEQPIRKLTIDRRSDVTYTSTNVSAEQFSSKIEGDRLQIAAPTISASTSATIAPSKVARKVESVKVDRGWEKAGDSAKVEELRKKMKSEAKAPAGLPAQPKFDRKADNATATEGTGSPAASPKMDATPKVKEPKAEASPKTDATPKVKEPKVKEPKVKSTPAETSPEMTPRMKSPKGDDMTTPASSPKETKRPKATPDEAAATPGSKKPKKDPATTDMGTPAPTDPSTPKVKKQKPDASVEGTPAKPMKDESSATTGGEAPKREKKVKEKTETPSAPTSTTPSTDGAMEKRTKDSSEPRGNKMDSEPKAEKMKTRDGAGAAVEPRASEDKPQKEKKTKGEVASPTPSR